MEDKDLPDNVIPLFPDEMPPIEDQNGTEMQEYVWTNDPRNPMLRQLVRMLYYSVFENKIGLMHAKVKGEDMIHTLIVGVEETPDGIATWPIAKILTEEEQGKYLAPDGNGNYLGDEDDSDSNEAGEFND